jgi:multiple sugar transport system permease protein
MNLRKRSRRALASGLAFLAPNILGFLAFTLVPLFISLAMAFTNWDLRLHNMFNLGQVRFVGLANFQRLLALPDFWQYFGNTLFLMLGIPVSIAASLLTALMLSRKPAQGRRLLPGLILAGIGLGAGAGLLVAAGAAEAAFSILIGGLVAFLLIGGATIGSGFYRTIYYLPNFTAGVATYLLWKKMYDPHSGPINAMLQPALTKISGAASGAPGWFDSALFWGLQGAALLTLAAGARWIQGRWKFEQTDYLPHRRGNFRRACWRSVFVLGSVALLSWLGFQAPGGLEAARAGLSAPNWLTDYHWAKPAIIIMGLWASIGSNNMLLYLAALSNVPQELKEAAGMDGAGPIQTFRSVVWPQLAPITFFIVIMSVIHGLQGGFEMARTMTRGGPGGATTTLSYFVFNEGFDTGRLGYASAIAWTLFALVFAVTLFNWKFGQRNHE